MQSGSKYFSRIAVKYRQISKSHFGSKNAHKFAEGAIKQWFTGNLKRVLFSVFRLKLAEHFGFQSSLSLFCLIKKGTKKIKAAPKSHDFAWSLRRKRKKLALFYCSG
jgi:hypothetical protein